MTAVATATTPPALATLVDEVVAACRRAGDAEAIRQGRRAISGSELAAAVDAVAANLAAAGLQPGDAILFGVRPGIDACAIFLGALRAGALVSFVEPGIGPELFAARLRRTSPRWVIAESLVYAASGRGLLARLARRRGLDLPNIAGIDAVHVRVGRRLPGVPRAARPPATLLGASDTALPPASAAADAGIVVFTSGTTGEPKGVVHDAGSIAAAIDVMHQLEPPPADAVIYTHKLHAVVSGLLAGARSVIAPQRFDVERFLADVHRHAVTHTFLVPVDAWRLATHLAERGIPFPPSLRQLYLLSAPVTVPVLERLHEVAGPSLRVTCAYGMTEMAPVTMIDSRAKVASSEPGDVVGHPVPGVELRVDDEGELHVRGPHCFRGYLGGPEVDWHATGDLARIADDGSVVLLGRCKDMLLRGDFNLYPSLYEGVVEQIDGVGTCAIVGAPDPVTGDERVVWFVEPARHPCDERALRDAVLHGIAHGATAIDRRAHPDELRIVPALPRSGRSTKIDRERLRQLAADTQEEQV